MTALKINTTLVIPTIYCFITRDSFNWCKQRTRNTIHYRKFHLQYAILDDHFDDVKFPDFFVPRKYRARRSIYNTEFSKYTKFYKYPLQTNGNIGQETCQCSQRNCVCPRINISLKKHGKSGVSYFRYFAKISYETSCLYKIRLIIACAYFVFLLCVYLCLCEICKNNFIAWQIEVLR